MGTMATIPVLNWPVVVEVDRGEAFQRVNELQRLTMFLAAGLILVTGVCAYLLALTIVQPLEQLRHGAGQVATGNLTVDLPVRNYSEVGYLTQVFNRMVQALRDGRDELDRVNDPVQTDAFANGQLILVEREAYEYVGGHGAIKDRILDDVGLAEAFKRRGLRIALHPAPWAFRVRLYTSLREILAGYGKNLYEGMGRRPAVGLGAVLFIFVGTLLPFIALVGGLVVDPFRCERLERERGEQLVRRPGDPGAGHVALEPDAARCGQQRLDFGVGEDRVAEQAENEGIGQRSL